jgi:hypothetical protein
MQVGSAGTVGVLLVLSGDGWVRAPPRLRVYISLYE